MNFVPMTDPRKKIIADLSAQIDHYLATGERIQHVPPGASGERLSFSTRKKARTRNASDS
ncbi:hypothetical protein ACIPL1_30715 [Pseudomonas sp. NPDC090202]|uniref:hypothetical protein n=1 Tax=Pseudomonas sp. NPDC090202 TaxID=3364476 RepID=UPI0037F2DAB6